MAISCSGRTESKVKGTPIWLFKLPKVAIVLYFSFKTTCINSFVVVFPLLPVKAIKGIESCFLWKLDNFWRHSSASLTRIIFWWVLYCYQLLKDAINSEKKDYGIFDTFELSSDLKDKVISLLEKKLVDPPKKINAKIRITCFTCEGIDAIKEALRAGLQMSTSNIKISIQLESSPFYNIFTVTDKVSDGIKLINDCISVIERTILDKKGEFKIEHNPTVAKID